MSERQQKRVVVVGAGWAGLGATYHLAQQGYEVTPKEKLDKIGQPSLVLGLELLIFRSWQAKRATY
jgi:flavin-dependent dehydrogenase